MTDWLATLAVTAASMSAAELVAVLLAIAYLLLAIRQSVLCWPVAIASSGIYIWLMYAAGLYMESALQVFYVAMAGYGWYSWLHGYGANGELPVVSWPPVFHLLPVLIILLLASFSGSLLAVYTDAAMPFTDSFTTWGAIVTTWMVARKILQNWHYWFVLDAVSVYMYLERGLVLTAGLFCIYLVLIVVGYRAWRASMDAPAG